MEKSLSLLAKLDCQGQWRLANWTPDGPEYIKNTSSRVKLAYEINFDPPVRQYLFSGYSNIKC